MKKLLGLVLLLALALPALGQADWVFSWTDATGTPQPFRKVYLYPDAQTRSAVNGQGITTLDRIVSQTASNGSVMVSNLLAGRYRAEFLGTYQVTTNWFNLPATNGLQYAADFLESPTLYAGLPVYSKPEADGTFWRLSVLVPGTNVSFRTNGGKVFIDGPGGGSNPNALTNRETRLAVFNNDVAVNGNVIANRGIYLGDIKLTNDAESGDLVITDPRADSALFYSRGRLSGPIDAATAEVANSLAPGAFNGWVTNLSFSVTSLAEASGLLVSGAGSAAVNQLYVASGNDAEWVGDTDPRYVINYYPASTDAPFYEITFTRGLGVLYRQEDLPPPMPSPWQIVNGDAPAPTMVQTNWEDVVTVNYFNHMLFTNGVLATNFTCPEP